MLDWLSAHTLLPANGWMLLLALFGAMCIGLSKSGLAGTATLNVVIMAWIFGAKPSVGLVLPLLIVADLLGYLIDETDLINAPGVDLGRLMHLLGSGAVG